MAATRLLTGVVVLTTLLCIVSASQNTVTDRNTGRKNNKKVDDMVNDMYTAFMMTKNVMSMMLMFVSPIIQIKGFGLSVMNTLINIGRFLLQMQATKRLQEMTQMHHVMPQVYHADQKVLMDHHKEPVSHFKIHEDPHKDHDNSVYIIKDHDHDSWGGENHDLLTNDHDNVWNKETDDHWKTGEYFLSPTSHDQKWSSSQKFAYYAPPPATPFSSRLGVPPTSQSSPQHSLSPAHASYVSGDIVGQLYPYFTPNLTTFR